MRFARFFAVCTVLALPQSLAAAEQTGHRYTPKEQIVFTPATMLAFDHSGKMLVHKVNADGSSITEHNGSLGNVTVARLGPDGKIETFCTTDILAATAWMAGETGNKTATPVNLPVAQK